jgi:hypothetical protein
MKSPIGYNGLQFLNSIKQAWHSNFKTPQLSEQVIYSKISAVSFF